MKTTPAIRRLLLGCLAACILVGMQPSESRAQHLRPDGAFYLKPKLGLNTYGGDWARSTSPFAGPPGPSTGLEVGYRQRMGFASGALGFYFLAGRYPAIARGASPGSSPLVSELEQWRHTLGLVGQIGLAPDARLNPYVQLGAGATVGTLDKDFRAAFSPLAGAGVDVALTNQVGVFVEATGILSVPDRGLDGAADLDSRSADWFSFFGAGVRINLGPSFTPVNVQGIDGPTQLRPGEAATFTAVTNDEATEPVTYRWDFGDGATGTGRTAMHRFEAPGNYTLVLTGRNESTTDRQRLTLTVTEPTPAVASRDTAADAPRETTVRFSDEDARQAEEANETSARSSSNAPSDTRASDAQADASISCDDIVDLNATYFEEGSDALNVKGLLALQENLEVLKQCPGMTVRLDAYAASSERNAQQLAEARARSVERLYRRGGIAANRIIEGKLEAISRTTGKMMGISALRRVDTVPTLRTTAADAAAAGAEE